MVDLAVLKQMLGWEASDTSSDDMLSSISDLIEAQLKNRLGGVEAVPAELEYIVTNCTIARFNQIGSEGLTSHSVGEEKQEWLKDIFAPYADDIAAYLDRRDQVSGGVAIRFF